MTNNGRYILDEQDRVVPEPDLFKWAEWFQNSDGKRTVARTRIGAGWVSTKFLGLDHSYPEFSESAPIVWETMVFSNDHPLDQAQDRCSGNREQAQAMHEQMVARVKAATTC